MLGTTFRGARFPALRRVYSVAVVGHGVGVFPREIIPAAAIARRVAELGSEIDTRIPPGPLTVVGVLRGAFMFMADLVRAAASCWSRTSSTPA